MLMKDNALQILEQMNEVLESSKVSMEKKVLSPEVIYKNIKQLIADLERVTVIINRES